MDTTAIIQFIGIVLFTTSVANDPGMHAILPRIGHAHAPGGPSQAQESFVHGVEDHLALIIYREEDRLHNVGGWKMTGTLAHGWEYVRLNGEDVQFLTNGENGKPALPPMLPRVGAAPSCLTTQPLTLRPEFQPPYKGAAGVIDLRAGLLDTCKTKFLTSSDVRIDVRMRVQTEGALVIVGRKPNERAKTISLDGDAVVYVVNVPPEYVLPGSTDPHTGEPHWDAYNDMITRSCASAPMWPATMGPMSECDQSPLTDAYRWSRNNPPMRFGLINSECSPAQLEP